MRLAGRYFFAVLCVLLICGGIAGVSGSRADVPEREASFHKPHHPPQAIETAPVSAATMSADEWTGATQTGVAPRTSFSGPVAARRTVRAIAPAAETALDQRPPPRTLLA